MQCSLFTVYHLGYYSSRWQIHLKTNLQNSRFSLKPDKINLYIFISSAWIFFFIPSKWLNARGWKGKENLLISNLLVWTKCLFSIRCQVYTPRLCCRCCLCRVFEFAPIALWTLIHQSTVNQPEEIVGTYFTDTDVNATCRRGERGSFRKTAVVLELKRRDFLPPEFLFLASLEYKDTEMIDPSAS